MIDNICQILNPLNLWFGPFPVKIYQVINWFMKNFRISMMSHVQSTPLLSSTRCEQPWVPNIRREPWVVPTLRQELIAGMVNGFNDYLDSMLALAIHNMQSNIVEHFIASAACCSCYSYHVWSSRLVGLTFLRFLRVALFLHALQNHSGIESRDELGHRFLDQTPQKITFIRLCFKPICAL